MDPNSKHVPLYKVLAEAAVLWGLANSGYFFILPLFGIELSYNSAPEIMTAYFLIWSIASLLIFREVFHQWFEQNVQIWFYILLSLILGGIMVALVYLFSFLPVLHGPKFAPYTDLLLATPWYFLPKAAEILMQQVIIAALILTFHFRFHSLTKVILAYCLAFGGGHVIFFLLSGTPTPYATIMTMGAVLSSLFMPYLILRKRGGFLYCFMIHLVFYLFLAIILHVWPPAGYISF